jgi:hypothetical protein
MDGEMHRDDGALAATPVVDEGALEQLGAALLWRVGRTMDDGPVTVRVGFATAAPLFGELPRLRSASDDEIAQAVEEGTVRVEWVGPRAR